MHIDYPERLEIYPLTAPPHTTVRVPGSKSITNRALVLAALTTRAATDFCNLTGALHSEDTVVMVDSLQRLGFRIAADWASGEIRVHPPATTGLIPAAAADLFVANSGTTMRFLTALVALGHGRYRLDGIPRMRERPIRDLLDALASLGVDALSETGNGCPPVVVEAKGLRGGAVTIRGDTSSQFLTGLLMAAPFAETDMTITVEGTLVSVPYVLMTYAMLGQFQLKVGVEPQKFVIPARQTGGVSSYAIEPDASAASYFFGAAAVSDGTVSVDALPFLPFMSLQGDMRFVEVLGAMGCEIGRDADRVTIRGGRLRGIDVDMNDISDTVMTLAVVACFAEGPTTIRNVGHIRHKETDRLAALATELRRLGAEVDEWDDGLRITPRPLHGAVVQTYNDHRMAMSLALVGLRVPGVIIDQPACVAKTYPHFFQDLERLRSAREV